MPSKIRSVRIEVDLASVVGAVPVQVAPGPGGGLRVVSRDAGQLRRNVAEVRKAPEPSLENGLPVPQQVIRGVNVRHPGGPPAHLYTVEAGRRREFGGHAARRRLEGGLGRKAEPGDEIQSPDAPGVLPEHANIATEVRRGDRIVEGDDLCRHAVVEPQFVIPGGLIAARLEKPRIDEVEPGLELVAARQQIRPVVADGALGGIPIAMNSPTIARSVSRPHLREGIKRPDLVRIGSIGVASLEVEKRGLGEIPRLLEKSPRLQQDHHRISAHHLPAAPERGDRPVVHFA